MICRRRWWRICGRPRRSGWPWSVLGLEVQELRIVRGGGSGNLGPCFSVGGAEDRVVGCEQPTNFRGGSRTREEWAAHASDLYFQVAPPSSVRPISPPSATIQNTRGSGVLIVSAARFEANCICWVRAISADSRAWCEAKPEAEAAGAAAAVCGERFSFAALARWEFGFRFRGRIRGDVVAGIRRGFAGCDLHRLGSRGGRGLDDDRVFRGCRRAGRGRRGRVLRGRWLCGLDLFSFDH